MQTKANILAIVPARAGSKRIKGKNKKKLAGKELVRYAIEAALEAKLVSKVVVTSDDEDILAIARKYDKVIAIRRPESISGDRAAAITYVHHALKILNEHFDYTAIVQPSSPFTLGKDIDGTIQLLLDNKKADSAVSITKLDHAIHPIKLKTLDGNVLRPFLEEEDGRMAAHELPELYARNCSVYVSNIATIKQGNVIGDHCLGYLMPRERSIDINDEIDFEFAAFLMNKQHG